MKQCNAQLDSINRRVCPEVEHSFWVALLFRLVLALANPLRTALPALAK
jgi:hypothetical protein